MTTVEHVKRLGITLTAEQELACRYLEAWGFQFYVHFGYVNAIEKAEEHQLQLLRLPKWTVQ